LRPSGRSIMLVIVVYAKTSEMIKKTHLDDCFLNHAEIVTAIAAELINTKTPVA
jgi:hypothetical protein